MGEATKTAPTVAPGSRPKPQVGNFAFSMMTEGSCRTLVTRENRRLFLRPRVHLRKIGWQHEELTRCLHRAVFEGSKVLQEPTAFRLVPRIRRFPPSKYAVRFPPMASCLIGDGMDTAAMQLELGGVRGLREGKGVQIHSNCIEATNASKRLKPQPKRTLGTAIWHMPHSAGKRTKACEGSNKRKGTRQRERAGI